MKEGDFEKLIEKYKEGNTTLKEEKKLFNNAQNLDPSFAAWSTFVRKNKTETPKEFNDALWKSFENKKTGKRKILWSIVAIAASILLIFSIYISSQTQDEQSYAEKERLLNQAKNMFADNKQKEIQYSVFYENEILTVYITNE